MTSDSLLAVNRGDLITFLARDKVVAQGEVQSVVPPGIVVVNLRTRDPKGVKKLDRLRVIAERRSVQMPSLLRVGYPSGARANLIFRCEHMSTPAVAGSLFRIEIETDNRFRLVVRNQDPITADSWPDTVAVRLFDDSADEEIAFERGELDAAMFWPGELSSHARELWKERLSAPRTRGVIAIEWLGPDGPADSTAITTADRLALLRIQRELFGGDLVFADSAQAAAVVQAHSDSAGRVAARFEVDHTLPGWQVIERLANARSGASPGPYAIRMSFVDAAAPERLNVPVQFVPHCPLLCRSGLEPILRPLRYELVGLLPCSPAAGR